MRLLLFSGSHARHLHLHKALCKRFEICGVVCMQREATLPTAPAGLAPSDRQLFLKHFELRHRVETVSFDSWAPSFFREVAPTLNVTPDSLNSSKVAAFIRNSNADAALIFGTDLILGEALAAMPTWSLNLHLGLSPYYKGSATLFWPFYFLEPQFAGATLHLIVRAADVGDIVCHIVPRLSRGQGLHDVAAQVVLASKEAVIQSLTQLEQEGSLPLTHQRGTGKLFLSNDFHPAHLRLIYEIFDDRIVDAWLDGTLGKRMPRLVRVFRQ